MLAAIPAIVAPRALAEPRLIVYVALSALWCAAEATRQPGGARGASSLLPRVQGAALFAIMVGGPAWAAHAGLATPTPLAAAGGAAMVAGIGLRVASLRALRCWFLDDVAVAPSQPLVRHGIYGWMRHPAEAGRKLLGVRGQAPGVPFDRRRSPRSGRSRPTRSEDARLSWRRGPFSESRPYGAPSVERSWRLPTRLPYAAPAAFRHRLVEALPARRNDARDLEYGPLPEPDLDPWWSDRE